MRRISSDISVLTEAFRAGKSKEMIPKMLRVLSRRTGVEFYNQDADQILPEEYTNASGKFLGFMVFMANGSTALRFNTTLGKSERIVSIDYFTKISDVPTYTIDIPPQFNIINILDQVALVITGDYFDIIEESQKITSKKKLKERITHTDILKGWIQSDPNIYQQIIKRGTNWDSILESYLDHIKTSNIRVKSPSRATLQIYCGAIVKELGDDKGSENIPHVVVRRGQPEQTINTDTESEQIFDKEIVQNEHLEKYEYMEWLFQQLIDGNKEYNGIYLYGQGGIGKSYTAEKMLKPLPNCYYFQGVIRGYTGLLQLLYDHRDNEIIVMDDTLDDKAMKNTTIQNILKLAMLPDPPNKIQLAVQGKDEDEDEDEDDIDSDDTGDQGESFHDFSFDSWLVFITNYPKVPQPIADRTERIEFIFSNEEIVDIIERALEKCEPKSVSLAKKKAALNWIRDNTKESSLTLSFRVFRKVANLYATAPPSKWESWARMKLKAGNK